MNWIDLYGLKNLNLIPHIQERPYTDNWIDNISAVGTNVGGFFINPLIDLLNAPLNDLQYMNESGFSEWAEASWYDFLTSSQAMGNLPEEMMREIDNYLQNVTDYHLDTPIDKQLADTGKICISAETWEEILKLFLAYLAAKGQPNTKWDADDLNNIENVKDFIGKDFEDYLTDKFGGSGSFKSGGREFDGAIGKIWYEAKSGRYWEDHAQVGKGFEKFKSDIGARNSIAKKNGATYELHSNTPIPNHVKEWLKKKGIPFSEH